MASYFADNYGVDKGIAKLKDFLQKLVNADEVQRMKFDMVSGETVVLYFRKSDSDENESPFHKWMIRQAIENCDDNVSVIQVATSGEALPDVELSNCYVECETSLKKRTDDLEQRVRKFSLNKPRNTTFDALDPLLRSTEGVNRSEKKDPLDALLDQALCYVRTSS